MAGWLSIACSFRFKRGTDLCEMDGSCWAGCPPASLSAGVTNAPGEKCMLTAPNTTTTTDGSLALTFGEPSASIGGEWVTHDVNDEDLAGTMFVSDAIDAMVADSHHHIKKALAHVAEGDRKTELLGGAPSTGNRRQTRTHTHSRPLSYTYSKETPVVLSRQARDRPEEETSKPSAACDVM